MKEANKLCTQCGAENIQMTKFCRNCGAKAELSEEITQDGQGGQIPVQTTEPVHGQAVEQAPELSGEQVAWQVPEQSGEQTEVPASELPGEQVAWQVPEQSGEQTEEPASELSGEQVARQVSEQSGEQTEVPASEQLGEQASEQQKPNKNKLAIIAVAAVGLIVIIVLLASLAGSGGMERQLGRLDSSSYSDIADWLDNEFVENFADDYELHIMAMDTNYRFLDDRFLDDEERFIEWSFHIDPENDTLFITLTYEELDLVALLTSELEGLNKNSLSDILDWIDRTEEELGRQAHLRVRVICLDGDRLSADIADMENEDLFEEWTFDIQDGFTVNIEIDLVFNSVRTFNFGDTFVFGGLEVVFEGDIGWDIDDNEWSSSYGYEYFKVPVTLTNISSTTITSFSPRLYAPDGTQIDRIFITGAEDDITRMGGLRPDASQSGYIFIKFDEDGDYVIEFRDFPLTIEVIIPVDSEELRGSATPLTTGPTRTLEDIAEDTQRIVDISEDIYDGMLRVEVEASGENELIFTYIYFQPVPAANAHLVNELMEDIMDNLMVFYAITAQRVKLELGLDTVIITVVFVDSVGTEFFRESVEF